MTMTTNHNISPPPAILNRRTFRRQRADAARHRRSYRRTTDPRNKRACVTVEVDEQMLNALARWRYLPQEAARASKKNAQLIADAIVALIRKSMVEDER